MSRFTIGSVSYLNARPLVDGLESCDGLVVRNAVPSHLLGLLLDGTVQMSLCPVIDYQLAPRQLTIVPVGAIGSVGPTLTVRVFSRQPLSELSRIHVDSDSHTSVALLQVVFHLLYQRAPELITFDARAGDPGSIQSPDALLLIGDKVVTREPATEVYPYQLDLGTAWHDATGLPFVFATWMTTAVDGLGDLPQILERRRRLNRERVDLIASTHAPAAGWPVEQARDYLGHLLNYELGEREIEAIELFWDHCHRLGIIEAVRPLRTYGSKFLIFNF